jgi:hypothetical protein
MWPIAGSALHTLIASSSIVCTVELIVPIAFSSIRPDALRSLGLRLLCDYFIHCAGISLFSWITVRIILLSFVLHPNSVHIGSRLVLRCLRRLLRELLLFFLFFFISHLSPALPESTHLQSPGHPHP